MIIMVSRVYIMMISGVRLYVHTEEREGETDRQAEE